MCRTRSKYAGSSVSGGQCTAAVVGASTLTEVESDLALGETVSPMLGIPGLTIAQLDTEWPLRAAAKKRLVRI
ncbi:MAG: hypothetical protein AB8B96_09535 [Lysobacterales bacterium]